MKEMWYIIHRTKGMIIIIEQRAVVETCVGKKFCRVYFYFIYLVLKYFTFVRALYDSYSRGIFA